MQLVSELIQVIPIKDPLDKTQKQAGQGYRGYATFVKNDAQGNTSKSRFG